jgi:hypothetical protein
VVAADRHTNAIKLAGLIQNVINQRTGKIKRIFRRAVSEELILAYCRARFDSSG